MAACGICSAAAELTYPAHLASLTRMRFFAALWVVVYHWRAPWSVDIDALTQLFAMGRFGVDLFFILSGFVLTHVYVAQREQGHFDFPNFIIARFARIWPLHVATIIMLAIVGLAASQLNLPFDAERFAVADLPANILMVHAWGFAPNLSWNGPSWSISAEWFAYLAFPAYLMAAIRLKHRPWVLLSIAVVMFFMLDRVHLQLFGETLPMATERYGVIRIIPEFLIGVALYRLGQAYRLPRTTARLALLGTVFVYLWAAHAAWDDRLIALLGAPLIFLLAELDRCASEQDSGVLTYLGDISYAVYMLHVPFFMVGFNVLQDVFGAVQDTMSTGLFLVLLVLMVGLSALTYEGLEKPARIYIRALGTRVLARFRGVR